MADPVGIIWNVYKAAKFVYNTVQDGKVRDKRLFDLEIQVEQVKEKMRIISGGTFNDGTSTLNSAKKAAHNQVLKDHCGGPGVKFEKFKGYLRDLQDEITISMKFAESLKKGPAEVTGFWTGLKAGVKKAKYTVTASSTRATLSDHTQSLTKYLAALTSIVQGMYVAKFEELDEKTAEISGKLAKISVRSEVSEWKLDLSLKREELKKVPKKNYERRHSAAYVTVEAFDGSKSSDLLGYVKQHMELSKAIGGTFEIGEVDGPRLQEMAQQILADVDLAKVVSDSGQTLKKFKEGIEKNRNGFEGFKKFVADFGNFPKRFVHYMIPDPNNVGEEKIKEALEAHAELIETKGEIAKLEAYYKKHAVVTQNRAELKEIIAKSDEGEGVTLLEKVLEKVVFSSKKIAGRTKLRYHSKTVSRSKESMQQLVVQIIEFYEAYTVEAATTELSNSGGCFASYDASAKIYSKQKEVRKRTRLSQKSKELGYHPITGKWGEVEDDCPKKAMWLRDAGFKTEGEGSREAIDIQTGLEEFDKGKKAHERAFTNLKELKICFSPQGLGELKFEGRLKEVVKCILKTDDLGPSDAPLADGKSCFKGRSFDEVLDGFCMLAQADDPNQPIFFC